MTTPVVPRTRRYILAAAALSVLVLAVGAAHATSNTRAALSPEWSGQVRVTSALHHGTSGAGTWEITNGSELVISDGAGHHVASAHFDSDTGVALFGGCAGDEPGLLQYTYRWDVSGVTVVDPGLVVAIAADRTYDVAVGGGFPPVNYDEKDVCNGETHRQQTASGIISVGISNTGQYKPLPAGWDGANLSGSTVVHDFGMYGETTLTWRLTRQPDYDHDGFPDMTDACPLRAGPPDSNGCPGSADPVVTPPETPQCLITATDDDGDCIKNNADNCQKTANHEQQDRVPKDGVGDACDPDLQNTPPCLSASARMHVVFHTSHTVPFPAGANGCWSWDHPTSGGHGGGIAPPHSTNSDWREHWDFCGNSESRAGRPMGTGFWVYEDIVNRDTTPGQVLFSLTTCATIAWGRAPSPGPPLPEAHPDTISYLSMAYRCPHLGPRCDAERRAFPSPASGYFTAATLAAWKSSFGLEYVLFQLYDNSVGQCTAELPRCVWVDRDPRDHHLRTHRDPIVTPEIYRGWLGWKDPGGRHLAGIGVLDTTMASPSLAHRRVLALCRASRKDGAIGIYHGRNNMPQEQMDAIVAAMNTCTEAHTP
jgi:hypothetical protein